MYILGISCFYHDAATAIIKDGILIAVAEEERFSRKKHDFEFPQLAIKFCLEQAGITAQDLDYVVFYEKPFLKFERILKSSFQTFPKSWKVFREAMTVWLLDKLWIKSIIQTRLNISDKKILFIDHHLSHAASSFLCSPFDEAAILTMDGAGEWTTTAYGRATTKPKNSIILSHEIKFPHSLGLLYSAFTAFLGFEVNEGEYKVMGMAPYGQPKYMDKIWQVIDSLDDGSFYMKMDYFSYHYSPEKTFSRKFEQLFGAPRDPKKGETLDPYYADIAASIQKVTEELILKMVRQVHKETGLKKLCIAGGVALNSVANGRIALEGPFEELYIQPAAGDGGAAIGAALYVYNVLLGKPRNFVMEHAFWGRENTPEEIKSFLTGNNISHEYIDDENKLEDRIVDYIKEGKVIGYANGRFEFGPRALGSRSIIADPGRPEMKDIVNRKIKFREAFRPFAPAVIAERAEEFFDLPNAANSYPARFMLIVAPVKESKRSVIPAITHVDGSGRLQVAHEKYNPRYYHIIKKFGQANGTHPVILNTSFNLKGEPIVNTPQNAYSTFTRSGLDVLVLDKYLVKK